MRKAVVDIVAEVLPKAAAVLADAGLTIAGSFLCGIDGFDEGRVRLILEDEAGHVLPERCGEAGWWMVSATFQQESYGSQTLTRIHAIELAGRMIFDVNGRARVERPPSPPDVTEQEAALARKGAILGRIAEGA